MSNETMVAMFMGIAMILSVGITITIRWGCLDIATELRELRKQLARAVDQQ